MVTNGSPVEFYGRMGRGGRTMRHETKMQKVQIQQIACSWLEQNTRILNRCCLQKEVKQRRYKDINARTRRGLESVDGSKAQRRKCSEVLRKTVNFSNWAMAMNFVRWEKREKPPPFILNLRPARSTQLKGIPRGVGQGPGSCA